MTAAKSTLDPAVLNYRATNIIVLVSAEAQKQTYPQIKKYKTYSFFKITKVSFCPRESFPIYTFTYEFKCTCPQ